MAFNPFNYKRRLSKEVKIGTLNLGGNQPVRVQSMANTDTNDIKKSVEQCVRTIHVGCELMRYTTQGIREVESLREIHSELRKQGYAIPIVADIHFNANAADLAAEYVEKVRINPGNFISSLKKKDNRSDYTEEEYQEEYNLLKKRFASFLTICKNYSTAVRIGVNHGSLSTRIMNWYGDTPEGMVESCLELLRVCREEEFENIVISMKTSNTVFMVHTVRLLVKKMEEEDFNFPLHLGVTEAGEGEDGRIRSAVGIGALLADGIGDTIRVSLSEDPEFEIPVAKRLVEYISERKDHAFIKGNEYTDHNPYGYERRITHVVKNIGGNNPPVVFSEGKYDTLLPADYFIKENEVIHKDGNTYKVYLARQIKDIQVSKDETVFLRLTYPELSDKLSDFLLSQTNVVILLETNHINGVGEQRAFFHALRNMQCTVPVILCREYKENKLADLQIKSAADMGVMFIDGFGDGILIRNTGAISNQEINSISFNILQASRVRITRTEYISCPGCGRTLFDLQSSVALVKKKTAHLKGLKIAVMGCIVNGPGEMADADYGYVGAGRGKVSLYRKRECVEQNIPEEEAVEKLLELIKKDKI